MMCGGCLPRGPPAGWSSCCCARRSATGWVAPVRMIDALLPKAPASRAASSAVVVASQTPCAAPVHVRPWCCAQCHVGSRGNALSSVLLIAKLVVQGSTVCALPQVYSLMVTPGQHANPLRRLWHELADRGEGLRSHWCASPALRLLHYQRCSVVGQAAELMGRYQNIMLVWSSLLSSWVLSAILSLGFCNCGLAHDEVSRGSSVCLVVRC